MSTSICYGALFVSKLANCRFSNTATDLINTATDLINPAPDI